MKRLPKKLSACILLALKDLEAVEGDVRYLVRMNAWHKPSYIGLPCAVCFAGSVMSRTLNVPATQMSSPSEFDEYNHKRLLALNAARQGLARDAQVYLDGLPHGLRNTYIVPQYDGHQKAFKAAMLRMAASLKKKGL